MDVFMSFYYLELTSYFAVFSIYHFFIVYFISIFVKRFEYTIINK